MACRRISLGPIVGFVAGWVIFAAAIGAIGAAALLGWIPGAVSSHNWLKTLLLAASIAFMLADARPLGAFGFCAPRASCANSSSRPGISARAWICWASYNCPSPQAPMISSRFCSLR